MNQEKLPFVPKQADNKISTYLGSDGLPITETYNLYLKKCDEFKIKARKYAKDNLRLKNSILHHVHCGYESSEKLEEEVLLEREEHIKLYRKAFNISCFDDDPNLMYECFTGKSKRIRIIRELHEERVEEFSNDFDNKRVRWFTRYCILSRFIQGARKVILLNRLKKALTILKTLTPEVIQKIDHEIGTEEETLSNEEEVHSVKNLTTKCICKE